MRKRFVRVLSTVLASVMAVSMMTGGASGLGSVKAAEEDEAAIIQDSASQVNYSTILGRGVDFGIVADKFQQINHMQTTYAVNVFANKKPDNAQIDLIPPNSTAQILIGSKDPDSERTVYAPFVFGNAATGATIHIEAPHSVYEADNGEVFDGTQTSGYFVFDGCNAKFALSENEKTSNNIMEIFNNVKGHSDVLNTKASSSDYAIDYKKYVTEKSDDNRKYTFDFTSSEFDNKVIYINVDNDLATCFKESEGLYIKKNSSSVIVFNIGENVKTNFDKDDPSNISGESVFKIDCYNVEVDGKKIRTTNYSSASTDPNELTRWCDKEICQKIIWNVTTSKDKVVLGNTSGLFLVPNSPIVDVENTSAGWIVAKNLKNTAGEWHYIYHGGNQEFLNDTKDQIHFAARKAFTHAWNGANTKEDTTVFADKDDFSFIWFENDENFSKTDSSDYKTVSNASTSKIQFPTLRFYTNEEEAKKDGQADHYVADKKTFYYTIKEQNSGTTTKDGIQISTGNIDIVLTVVNNNGRLEFYVKSKTYLGTGALYKENKDDSNPYGIRMSGVEFSLGAFFNLVTSTLQIEKVVEGDYIPTDSDEYSFTVVGEDGHYYDENGKASSKNLFGIESPLYVRVPANKSVLIKNLPEQKYTITETPEKSVGKDKNPIERKGYTCETTGSPAEVKVSTTTTSVVTITNKYTAEKPVPTKVVISKQAASGNGSNELPGAVLTLTGKDENNNEIDLSKADVTLGEKAEKQKSDNSKAYSWKSGNTSTVINDLPDGYYNLHEDAAPAGYQVTNDLEFKIEKGKAYTKDASGNWVEAQSNKIVLIDELAPTPTPSPTAAPTAEPTKEPTPAPTAEPTATPTAEPTAAPTEKPTPAPTKEPTPAPTAEPTAAPTEKPTPAPTEKPTPAPTEKPTAAPTEKPTPAPTEKPTAAPTEKPTAAPTEKPTPAPTEKPTAAPTEKPTPAPTAEPTPAKTDVVISKRAASGNGSSELQGAELTLTGKDVNGNAIDLSKADVTLGDEAKELKSTDENAYSWISGKTSTTVKNLPDGTYKLHEETAPIGYSTASDIEFKVEGGKVYTKDDKGNWVEASKNIIVMIDEDEPTPTPAPTEKPTAAPTEKPTAAPTEKPTAAPTEKPTAAPTEKPTAAPTEKPTPAPTAEPTPAKTDVVISKRAASGNGSSELQGAELTLTGKDVNGNAIDLSKADVTLGDEAKELKSTEKNAYSWVSGKTSTTVKNLPDGTYNLHEETAPIGYSKASDIEFKIEGGKAYTKDDKGNWVEASKNTIVMIDEDAKTDVVISKRAASGNGSSELQGAELTLTGKDAKGNTIDLSKADVTLGDEAKTIQSSDKNAYSWVSGKTSTTVKNLPDGTYNLHEETAPIGYSKASDIEFKIEGGKAYTKDDKGNWVEASKNIIVMIDEDEPTPTPAPTEKPTAAPTEKPTAAPTEKPTAAPTEKPTAAPTEKPTAAPTEKPTAAPTEKPTPAPTEKPTAAPTEKPTAAPTDKPTAAPTEKPTAAPTDKPTAAPTEKPTAAPTEKPTAAPTEKPTAAPTEKPTEAPTAAPTEAPTPEPTEAPTAEPTASPTPNVEDKSMDFSKKVAGGDELEGAKIELTGKTTDADGKEIDVVFETKKVKAGKDGKVLTEDDTTTTLEWISGKTPTTIKDIPDGTYTMKETATPDDSVYEYATEIVFEVKDGKVTKISDSTSLSTNADGRHVIVMFDALKVQPTPEPTEEPTPAPTEEPTPAPTDEPTPAPTEVPSEEPTTEIPEATPTPEVTTEEDTEEEDDEDEDTGTLVVTVLDEKTKKPVPKAKVEVKKPDGKTKTYTTDENGKVKVKNLPEGDYKITVKEVPDGYTVKTGKEEVVEVVSGETAEHTALIVAASSNSSSASSSTSNSVKTGDSAKVIPIIIVMLISLIGIVALLMRKKRS